MGHFEGQIAVITGAGSGIGRATAMRLAKEGAKVHVVDLRGESAAGVVGEIEAAGGRARAHTLDVSDSGAVAALAAAVYAEDDRCDILHNNAGFAVVGAVEDVTIEDWQRIMNVNVLGAAYGVHAFVPRMLAQGGGGHIVNTASMVGLIAWPLYAPYVTSKHALVGMTKVLDTELGPRGIRAHAICPGVIDTPMVNDAPIRGDRAGTRENAVETMKKFGAHPDVVAEAVVDAIRKNKVIRTVPEWQVRPQVWLDRLSPSLNASLGRLISRVMTKQS